MEPLNAIPPLWDLHTHHLPAPGVEALVNVDLTADPARYADARHLTAGIHPWQAQLPCEAAMRQVQTWLDDPRCIALGESGLDRCCTTPFDTQLQVFRRMAQLSVERRLPLIIHCVRAWNEVIALRRTLRPEAPWVIHGFRGKAPLAEQLLTAGFYLSYGHRYQEEALRHTPLDRLLLESDEAEGPLLNHYQQVARHLGISVATLVEAVTSQVNHSFLDCKVVSSKKEC